MVYDTILDGLKSLKGLDITLAFFFAGLLILKANSL